MSHLFMCGSLILALAGCGAGPRDTDTTDALGRTDTTDALGRTDNHDDDADAATGLETTAADVRDASPNLTVPRIDEVLTCGVDGNIGGLAASSSNTALERKTLDTARFPDALCNDGSAAVVYIRPAARSEDADKWVLELMGGGGCNSVAACARRWCGVETNFSRTQMTSLTSPARSQGTGILARPEAGGPPMVNPWADWNHVLVKYCSSDTWRGTARDVVVDTVHPKTGEPVTFRMHFLGRRILEAVIATLRADGGPPLTYGALPMADLDDATEVVFAGASAGGGGVTFNLDWLAETLRATNPEVFVSGLIDSTFGPDLTALDFSQSTFCEAEGTCTVEAFLTRGRVAQDTLWRATPEETCDAAHVSNGEGWRCASDTFVMLNHLTTPFFVRQGLADGLISDVYVEGGLRYGGQPMDLRAFGGLVRDHLRTFPTLAETALEGTALTKAPGAFGPACSKHETLRSNGDTFAVTITVGEPLAMFDVWQRWRLGQSPSVVVTETPADTRCAD
jgi:hypothetical protein